MSRWYAGKGFDLLKGHKPELFNTKDTKDTKESKSKVEQKQGRAEAM